MSGELRYLLDTDTCVYLPNGVASVRARLAEVGVQQVAVAMPTVGELFYGAHYSTHVDANVGRIRAFLSPPRPEVLQLSQAAAERFGQLKAGLRRHGLLIGDVDLLIAAVGLVANLTLVTNNTAHFCRIPSLPVENWLSPPSG